MRSGFATAKKVKSIRYERIVSCFRSNEGSQTINSGSKIGIAGHNEYLFKADGIIQHGQVPQALSPRVHQMSDR